MFPKFPPNLHKRKKKMNGILQKICLLIQIQNEPCSYKAIKNF